VTREKAKIYEEKREWHSHVLGNGPTTTTTTPFTTSYARLQAFMLMMLMII
jgi:hypothetical protein